jgi:hypothetical protein
MINLKSLYINKNFPEKEAPMDITYDLEVSKEDERVLRNDWKLVSICQFINMFKNVLKLKDVVNPYDLE